MATYLIRYAEIGLKGKNRSLFENQLIANIKQVLNTKLQAKKIQKQIIISGEKINPDKLTTVFGIAWFAPVTVVANNLKAISAAALKLVQPKQTFAVRAKHDLEISLGDIIRTKKKLTVNLDNPQQTICVVQLGDQALVFNQKIPGPGGLPVNTSGKVLSLISGGFDSIISSYLLAKRGARVDFLHFHVFADHQPVLKSKINTIVKNLTRYTLSESLFLASYTPFQLKLLDQSTNQELIVFRRFMVRLAQQLAKKHGYQALVLGDSLGQVASQTIDNIIAVDQAVDIPIFRPLIGMDKQQIINQVKDLGLEAVTNQTYKDCCSLVASHPATKPNLNRVQLLEQQINLDQIINDTLTQIDRISLKSQA